MAQTVKVPGLGQVKTTYVVAGVGVMGGIIIYAYWRSAQGGAAEEVTEEAAAEELPGTDLGEPTYDYALGAGGYDYGSGVSYPIYQSPSTSGTVPSGQPTSNAEWAQKAREELAGEGADSAAASSAIGNYLAKLCVSAAQADLIRRANAMIGAPPQGTYSIITCPGTPPAGGDGGGTPGASLPAPKRFHVDRATRSTLIVDWDDVPGAKGYRLYRNGAVVEANHPAYSLASYSGLKANTAYTLVIRPIGSDGAVGAAATITARTTK